MFNFGINEPLLQKIISTSQMKVRKLNNFISVVLLVSVIKSVKIENIYSEIKHNFERCMEEISAVHIFVSQ